ncbi:Holliday junction branch migration protein RuvA [Aquirhabdus parva]|uniref:Holliday junction branch migration complex subunit RuvA n=1 Tax=Aquirhabdus parva TaxID=2283318 RepID=A0A345P5D7_9GAMM|nr:Holliday junction branch migration protein RuvA [Aquirhabdus parva]AXI02496.1 Holliday junction branch migration protein RuvA [Aquirhabdus parva]
MIGSLTGKIQLLTAPHILIEVGGIGYEVETPLSTFCQLKNEQVVTLWTHLTVREDTHLLYGFINTNDKALFRILLKVNGVGPKLALGILSGMSAAMLIQSIEMQDISTLTRIPGVGKKTAERLVIELRDRLQGLSTSTGQANITGSAQITLSAASPLAEAEAALVSLGYKPLEAQRAIAAVKNDHQETADLIRAALKGMLKT